MKSFFVLCLCLVLSACSKEPLYQEQGFVFGTLVEVSIYGETEPRAKQAIAQVMHEFRRLHDKLHAWQPSELSRLNTAFAQGQSMLVTPELASMLQDATQLSKQSKGLFNPAIGGLIQLWGFQADEFKAALPAEKQLALWLKRKPSMSDIVFVKTPKGMMLHSLNKFVRLDLGGYAKGYALDRAAYLLHKQGINNALINIGGNILALGQHGARAWRVGIKHPRKAGALATLDLHDGEAIGTSGDYQRYFLLAGKRYCHLIDPRDGHPKQGVEAVTILTQGLHAGVRSDAASKPLFISGVVAWRSAAARMKLKEAMLIDADGQIHLSKALQKRLKFTDKKVVPQVE